MRVYLDNAATTPLSQSVIEAMTECMQISYGNPSSIHTDGRSTRVIIEDARKTIANGINASIGEIFFTSGGTESNNMALRCAVRDLGVTRIITTKIEHHCILHTEDAVERDNGIEVIFINCDDSGRSDLDQLETTLASGDQPTLVSIMHANNEIGTINDLKRISEICKSHEAYLHSDTIQTMAHFPIDVEDLYIHFLSGSGHKFHGPKGSGFIYINNDITIKPYIDGGSQERNMRAGTENVYGIRGLAVAFEEALREMEPRKKHISIIRAYLKEQLTANFDDIHYHGVQEEGAYLYTVLNVCFPKSAKSEMMLLNLDIEGISASGGSACTSGAEGGSHVLNAIKANPERKSIRFSFSHNNTQEEVDFLIDKLKKIIPVKEMASA